MADVFLSYARGDAAMASRLAKALEGQGFSVWWDADLPAHRAYSDVIEARLEDARAVIVLWSAAAAKSQWVRAEAEFARSHDKLVQAQLDDGLPPMPFNQTQCASLKGWRGAATHPGFRKLAASVGELVGHDYSQPVAAPTRRSGLPRAGWLAAAGVLLLLVAVFVAMRLVDGGEAKRPVVAVLPFESIGKSDDSLVAGIWEDTRQAIGRNPQLMVLGPNTAREIAEKGSGTARKLADYLVEASVRSAGDRVRVSANLVRTRDGSEVWSKSFDRKLDDVFVLQSEIAGEIEGHIRGRLDYAMLAPFLALGLRQAEDSEEAARVLAAAERILTANRVDRRRGQQALLARVHAVQGRGPQALSELSDAVRGGWLPTPPHMLNDIALDPAFESIKTDGRFLAARQHILNHLAKERAELGPVSL